MPNYTSKTAAQGSVLFWLSQEVWRIRARERLIRVPVRLTRSTALVREPRSYWGSRRCRLAAENVGQGRIGGGRGPRIEPSLRKGARSRRNLADSLGWSKSARGIAAVGEQPRQSLGDAKPFLGHEPRPHRSTAPWRRDRIRRQRGLGRLCCRPRHPGDRPSVGSPARRAPLGASEGSGAVNYPK